MGLFDKKRNWIPSLVAVLSVVLLAAESPSARYFEIAKNLDIFASLYKEVNTNYVDEVNPAKVIKTGIDAMLNSLDPYTSYIPEDDIEDYRTMTTGQYGGIGAVIGKRDGKTVVMMPYLNYPAYTSGLRIGDELIEIDGVDVVKKPTGDISKLLKGQAGTLVKIKVKKLGESEIKTLEITRQKIKMDNVPYYGMIDDEVGYVKLTDFTADASKEVRKAMVELKEKGMKRLVLDLRDNPGGLLNEAINISNLFIPKDLEVVSTKGKVLEWNKNYKALNSPLDTEVPVAVMISPRSASASEIVAGVLQDYDRGVLVGQRSFGKGLVQTTKQLTYNAQLKVTTAKYYIPSGRCIQAIDYSNRGADGSLSKVPDSLRKVFKTRNGRKVYDGGGVSPDITVEPGTAPAILISLENKGHLFNYASEYFLKHPKIIGAKEFTMTDAEYGDFVKWLNGKDYDYTTKVETTLTELENNAKKELYLDDIKEQLESLKKRMGHNKDQDLQKHKAEIKEALESQIVSRYYLERGVYEADFDNDKQLLAAIKALKNPEEYSRILKGQDTGK